MTISRGEARRAALLLALMAGGCGRDGGDAAAPEPARASVLEAVLPPGPGTIGELVVVGLRHAAEGPAPVAVQGRVSFDTAAFRYVGQPVTGHLVMIGDSAAWGRLRFAAVHPEGLPADVATIVLERRVAGAAAPSVELEEVTGDVRGTLRRPVLARREASLPVPASLGRPGAREWIRALGFEEVPDPRRKSVAGDGLLYGDANLNGAVTGADYVAIANVAVGNLPLLTAENRDFAIAANVAPANLPGLGEAGDPVPPGRNPDGSFTITGSDAAIVAGRSVGQTVAIAGEPIPGRTPAALRVVLRDTIAANRVLTRDTIYEIEGKVVVGHPEVPDVTLTIEAGTRLEGDPATRAQLIVRRGANLVALGTRLQPVVLTCRSAAPVAGCWGGLVLNGFGVLNNGESGGSGGVGFPFKEGLGGSGRYGGNLPEDSSGALRYVRIEYAGAFPVNASDRLPGLQLLGVGSRTVLDSVQVHASAGDGILVSGGSARLRATLITASGRDGLTWADGWQGAAQFVVVQQAAGARHAVHGANFAANPAAGPRSAPTLANVTLVGSDVPAPGARGVLLEHGSGVQLVNLVLRRAGDVGFDVEGAASCALAGDSLDVRASILRNAPGPEAAADADCLDEAAFLAEPARGNRFLDPGLVAPLATRAPDWRPVAGSAATTGAAVLDQPVVPPPFFVSAPGYVGAVAPANLFGTNVPWFAGWSRTF